MLRLNIVDLVFFCLVKYWKRRAIVQQIEETTWTQPDVSL